MKTRLRQVSILEQIMLDIGDRNCERL